LFLYACDFPQGMGSGGSGLTVHLSRAGVTGAGSSHTGLSQSVLSDGDIGSLEYKVTFTDPGGTFIERTVRGGSVSVALDPGDWKIDAKAYAPPRSNWRQSGGK
jgi:hypothetical protein